MSGNARLWQSLAFVEMDQMEVTSALENVAGLVTGNLHGQSIAHAEFWADTFDRWAEQLVGPG